MALTVEALQRARRLRERRRVDFVNTPTQTGTVTMNAFTRTMRELWDEDSDRTFRTPTRDYNLQNIVKDMMESASINVEIGTSEPEEPVELSVLETALKGPVDLAKCGYDPRSDIGKEIPKDHLRILQAMYNEKLGAKAKGALTRLLNTHEGVYADVENILSIANQRRPNLKEQTAYVERVYTPPPAGFCNAEVHWYGEDNYFKVRCEEGGAINKFTMDVAGEIWALLRRHGADVDLYVETKDLDYGRNRVSFRYHADMDKLIARGFMDIPHDWQLNAIKSLGFYEREGRDYHIRDKEPEAAVENNHIVPQIHRDDSGFFPVQEELHRMVAHFWENAEQRHNSLGDGATIAMPRLWAGKVCRDEAGHIFFKVEFTRAQVAHVIVHPTRRRRLEYFGNVDVERTPQGEQFIYTYKVYPRTVREERETVYDEFTSRHPVITHQEREFWGEVDGMEIDEDDSISIGTRYGGYIRRNHTGRIVEVPFDSSHDADSRAAQRRYLEDYGTVTHRETETDLIYTITRRA